MILAMWACLPSRRLWWLVHWDEALLCVLVGAVTFFLWPVASRRWQGRAALAIDGLRRRGRGQASALVPRLPHERSKLAHVALWPKVVGCSHKWGQYQVAVRN